MPKNWWVVYCCWYGFSFPSSWKPMLARALCCPSCLHPRICSWGHVVPGSAWTTTTTTTTTYTYTCNHMQSHAHHTHGWKKRIHNDTPQNILTKYVCRTCYFWCYIYTMNLCALIFIYMLNSMNHKECVIQTYRKKPCCRLRSPRFHSSHTDVGGISNLIPAADTKVHPQRSTVKYHGFRNLKGKHTC